MGGDIKIMISDNIYVTTMKYVNIMIIITMKYILLLIIIILYTCN